MLELDAAIDGDPGCGVVGRELDAPCDGGHSSSRLARGHHRGAGGAAHRPIAPVRGSRPLFMGARVQAVHGVTVERAVARRSTGLPAEAPSGAKAGATGCPPTCAERRKARGGAPSEAKVRAAMVIVPLGALAGPVVRGRMGGDGDEGPTVDACSP